MQWLYCPVTAVLPCNGCVALQWMHCPAMDVLPSCACACMCRDATIMGSRNGHAPIYLWYTLTRKVCLAHACAWVCFHVFTLVCMQAFVQAPGHSLASRSACRCAQMHAHLHTHMHAYTRPCTRARTHTLARTHARTLTCAYTRVRIKSTRLPCLPS